ncbi:MAG: dihydroorotate dehydrogenase [Thermovirgaceae bacterium]
MNFHKKMAVHIGGLDFATPLLVASGVWPMDTGRWPTGVTEGVGGICTKGLTLNPKEGNPGIRIWETPCGVMNSIGLQNPGIDAFLGMEYANLKRLSIPLIFNLSFDTEEDLLRLLERLQKSAGTVPVELNVSCPNVSSGGISWAQDIASLESVISLARKTWGGPLWVKLSPNVASITSSAIAAEKAGADALTVANTWLGMAIDPENLKPVFQNIHAGLSGPAVFPLTLRLVWETSSAVRIPVIASGGISSWQDAAVAIAAGASAVQLGSAFFRDLRITSRIERGLSDFLDKKGLDSVARLVGAAKSSSPSNP